MADEAGRRAAPIAHLRAPAAISASLKSQSVFASGTGSLEARPQNRPPQPVCDQVFRLIQRWAVHRLQHQHPELPPWIEARPAALRRMTRAKHRRHLRPEQLEVHRRRQLIKRITTLRELPQPVHEIPEPAWPCAITAPACPSERQNYDQSLDASAVCGGVQLLKA